MKDDEGQTNNVADANPDVVKDIVQIMQTEYKPSYDTADPVSPHTLCTKFDSTGYYDGQSIQRLGPESSPNRREWTWQQCAARCARLTSCHYW